MLIRLFVCMILAAILQFILKNVLVLFYTQRFINRANAVLILYEAIYPIIEANFNDNNLRISTKFEYSGCKIKFRNALEGSVKFERLVQKVLKDYYKVINLLYLDDEEIKNLVIENGRIQLESACYEIRNIINYNQQEVQEEKL